jgi:NDP-sugar pyrophosphorylase family protein
MGYKDQRIEEYLKNVNLGGASITNSYDYAQGIAKGKAIKQALIDGKIDKNKRAFVAFPDDLFLDNKLPERAVVEHANAVNKFGIFASAVVAEAYRYPQGVVYADERGIVTRSEENPLVPLLTTVGMYIFEPPAYKYFLDLIDLKKEGPAEFEVAVMPKLANEGKEYAIKIPPDTWIAINTIKELEKAQRLVESGAIPKR